MPGRHVPAGHHHGGARIWGRTAYIGPNGSNDGSSWSPWGPIDGMLTGITAIGDPDRRIELFDVDGWGGCSTARN